LNDIGIVARFTKTSNAGDCMSNKVRIIVFVILPLVIGFLIYALLREQPPFKHLLPWITPVIDISTLLPRFLYVFVLYRLPDMLWAFSFLTALDIRLKNPMFSSFIVISLFILYEYLQYEGIIRGTGDVGDIFFTLCAVLIYIFTKGGTKNAKNT